MRLIHASGEGFAFQHALCLCVLVGGSGGVDIRDRSLSSQSSHS